MQYGTKKAALWMSGAIAAAMMVACGGAQAQSGEISDARARQVALEHVPGTVVRVEHEGRGEHAIIEVVVRRSAGGELAAVEVDARTGHFIRIEAEDDDDDDSAVDERGSEHADEDHEVEEG